MPRFFLFVALWFACVFTNHTIAQEFKEHNNGLIYDEPTMRALRSIVDSMNLKYKKCDPRKDYYSVAQASCNAVSLDSFDVAAAVSDIKSQLDYNSFCKKYARSKAQKNLLVLKEKSKDYGDTTRLIFTTIELGDAYSRNITWRDTILYDKKVIGTWIFEYWPKTDYQAESVEALYFTTDFNNIKVPEKYGRMIQYSDCMIDTNSTIFTDNASESYRGRGAAEDSSKVPKKPMRSRLNGFIAKHTAKPDRNQYGIDSVYDDVYYRWADVKDSIIDSKLAHDSEFRALLALAIDEAIKIGTSDDEIESLALKYDTKQRALLLKRSRIVVGGCSQDSRPRVHAQEIAVLAAETANWDIFLRAHLDIMNDRFARVTDGSYAWGRRNTYIKELEKLDFDVTTLMMGISLRIANPSGNHYFGSIGRTGRALSETEKPDEVEREMVDAIKDEQLDGYNRIIMYYLYRTYIYHLIDSRRKEANINKLRNAVKYLPEEYASRITINNSDFQMNR